MADEFEDGLKDLVSEQFKDNEVMPLKDEKTGKFIKQNGDEDADDDGDEHDEEVGERERKAGDREDEGRTEDEDDDDDSEEADGDDEDADEDEDKDGDDDDDGEAEEDDKSKGKGKNRFQKRVDTLTASVRRLERELKAEREAKAAAAARPKKADGSDYADGNDYARDQLKNDPKAPKKPDPAAKGADGKPLYKLGEFDEQYAEDKDDYLDARRRYLDAKEKEYDTKTSAGNAAAANEGQQEFQTKLNSTVEIGKKAYKDFDEKVVKGIEKDEWPLSEAGAHFLVDSEVGADIAYHLATNVKVAKEIAGLSPIAQVKRFTKLEDQFIAKRDERKKKAKKGSSAPEPIDNRKRAGGGGGRETNRFDSEDFESVERNWNQANSKKR